MLSFFILQHGEIWVTLDEEMNEKSEEGSQALNCHKSQHIFTTCCSMNLSSGFGTHMCACFSMCSHFEVSSCLVSQDALRFTSSSPSSTHKAGKLWRQVSAVLSFCLQPAWGREIPGVRNPKTAWLAGLKA